MPKSEENIFLKKSFFYLVKKRILNNILKMENFCKESSKIINYLTQSADPDLGLRYLMVLSTRCLQCGVSLNQPGVERL
jgi:hypothetical protein